MAEVFLKISALAEYRFTNRCYCSCCREMFREYIEIITAVKKEISRPGRGALFASDVPRVELLTAREESEMSRFLRHDAASLVARCHRVADYSSKRKYLM